MLISLKISLNSKENVWNYLGYRKDYVALYIECITL